MRSRMTRMLAACGAALGWAALALQLMLTLALVRAQGGSALFGLWRFFGYFTIITNLFAAIVLSMAVFRRSTARLEFCAATAMIMVGAVYSLLLREIWNPQGLEKLADVALHDVLPVMTLLFWLFSPRRRLTAKDVAASLVLPLAFCAYAMVRGALDGWYPYPFIDVAVLGVARVAVNCAVIAVVFTAMAVALGWLDRRLP
jgi:hypothetical protein